MKNLTQFTCSFFLFLALNFSLNAQHLDIPRSSPKASISQFVGVCNIIVNYSRPAVKGRVIFGQLVPFGKTWRAGANEATIISFSHEVSFGGQKVAAGKYGLFVVPTEKKWIVKLNNEWDQWGAYNYDESEDVAQFELTPIEIAPTELLTFSFTEVSKTKASLNLQWANQQISIPIQTNTHQQTLAEISKAVNETSQHWYIYSAAAQYHYYERKEAEPALGLIDVAIALKAPNPAPWMLKSQILAAQGKYKEAIAMAKMAIEVSKKHNFFI